MIQITITYRCRVCGSTNIVKNGTNKCGHAQYYCKDCHAHRVLEPATRYTAQAQRTVLNTYKERASLRGLERIFGVARQTVLRWLKGLVHRLPDLKDTLLPVQAADVLELDELWSFVFKKDAKRWLWVALCRRTRQIVAFVIGDRSETTCRRLWNKIPESDIARATASAISGTPTRRSSVPTRTSLLVKRVARSPILSAGTTRSANGWPASCGLTV